VHHLLPLMNVVPAVPAATPKIWWECPLEGFLRTHEGAAQPRVGVQNACGVGALVLPEVRWCACYCVRLLLRVLARALHVLLCALLPLRSAPLHPWTPCMP
jgi:hypothetical protein